MHSRHIIPFTFSSDLVLPGLLSAFSKHRLTAVSGLKLQIEKPSNFIIRQSDSADSFSHVLQSDFTSFKCVKPLSHATLVAGMVSIKSK